MSVSPLPPNPWFTGSARRRQKKDEHISLFLRLDGHEDLYQNRKLTAFELTPSTTTLTLLLPLTRFSFFLLPVTVIAVLLVIATLVAATGFSFINIVTAA